jgi:hypothetical protein
VPRLAERDVRLLVVRVRPLIRLEIDPVEMDMVEIDRADGLETLD